MDYKKDLSSPQTIYRFSEIPMKVTGGCFGYYVDSNIHEHAKAEGHSVSNIKNLYKNSN